MTEVKFLDLYQQYLGISNEIDLAIADTIKDSNFIGGKSVKRFEDEFAKYNDIEHCIGVGNGTDALEIAIQSLNLPPNSEVIVPANAFIACSEAVSRNNLRIVFCDVDSGTYTIDVDDLAKRITAKTSAIMAVHLYGHPCDMYKIQEIASYHGIKVIEDCAQAHGAEYFGKKLGVFGDISTYSFYPGKNLGAYGDAGAIVTNDQDLAILCRRIANHGREKKYNHLIEGRNSRLDALQAAILSVKLKYLDDWVNIRNEIAHRYIHGLSDITSLCLPVVGENVKHAFHLFVLRLGERDLLQQHLKDKRIETGVHYPVALPNQKAYDHLGQSSDQFFAWTYGKDALSLPIGEHLAEFQTNEVVSSVRSFFNQ